MTDRSGPLRDWRAVLAAGLSVLVAAVVTLVARTGDPATADSYLGEVRNAVVVLADGSLRTAHDGLRVPSDAAVRTGAGGGASLTTAGRVVYLGALTTLRVRDGVRQELERGQVMVDGRNGPQLQLLTRAGEADVRAGALVRVETGPVLRLATFVGSASLQAAGRQVRTHVPALFQLLAPYTALPGTPTAMALTDDVWEQRLASELVNADNDLNALARGLALEDGLAVLQAAPVVLRSVVLPSTDRGEQALSVAVAQASRRAGPLGETLSFVLDARGQGGSWGVVAALAQARVTAVSALLDTVLAPPPGNAPPLLAGPSPVRPGLSSSEPTTGGSRSPESSPSPGPGPTGTRTPSPRPSTPSPSAPLDDLITTIVGLLSPSPSALIQLPK